MTRIAYLRMLFALESTAIEFCFHCNKRKSQDYASKAAFSTSVVDCYIGLAFWTTVVVHKIVCYLSHTLVPDLTSKFRITYFLLRSDGEEFEWDCYFVGISGHSFFIRRHKLPLLDRRKTTENEKK